MKQLQVIRERDRFALTGLSRVTWWRYERTGKAPRRIRLGQNSVGWVKSEIEQWVEDRIASREQAQRAALTIDSTDTKGAR